MAIQVYRCRKHGKFETYQSPQDPVAPTVACPILCCPRASYWVPSLPAYIHVEGGTGAGKSSHTR
jgi:hypothetical protein